MREREFVKEIEGELKKRGVVLLGVNSGNSQKKYEIVELFGLFFWRQLPYGTCYRLSSNYLAEKVKKEAWMRAETGGMMSSLMSYRSWEESTTREDERATQRGSVLHSKIFYSLFSCVNDLATFCETKRLSRLLRIVGEEGVR